MQSELIRLRQQLPLSAPGCGCHFLHAAKCNCDDPSCSYLHHYLRLLVFGMSEHELVEHIRFAINQMIRHGTLCLPDAPELILRFISDNIESLACSSDCACSCHHCGDDCRNDISGQVSSERPALQECTGVRWGIIGLMPTIAFFPQVRLWVRFADLTGFGGQWSALPPHQWPPHAEFVEIPTLLAARPVDVAAPVLDDSCVIRRWTFIAAEISGDTVEHQIVIALSPNKPPWMAILATDLYDPARPSFLFSIQCRNEDIATSSEWKPKQLQAECKRIGYLTFLTYLVVRYQNPGSHFTSCIVTSSRSHIDLLRETSEYVDACLRIYATEPAVSLLKRAFGASARGSQRAANAAGSQLQQLTHMQRVFTGTVHANSSRFCLIDHMRGLLRCNTNEMKRSSVFMVVSAANSIALNMMARGETCRHL